MPFGPCTLTLQSFLISTQAGLRYNSFAWKRCGPIGERCGPIGERCGPIMQSTATFIRNIPFVFH